MAMKKQHGRSLFPALITSVVLLAGGACGTSPQSTTPATRAQEKDVSDIASADPQVRFFHEQLIANGEDLQTEFGTDLSTLGMNPRDLQQDDPKHAYDTVIERVRALPDAELRRAMLRTFFNISE